MILKNTKFKYAQVREIILDAILSGNLAPDSILPSEQKLSALLGISRITLRTALRELEDANIIIKQNGRQSRVNMEALRKQRAPLRRIAWVDTSPIGQTNPIYFDIFRSISEETTVRNVKLDYISLTINIMAENFFAKQHEYDGLILGQFTRHYRHYLPRISHENCISVDCLHPGIAHCVKTDNYLGGQLAARTLLESGHSRVAYLGYFDPVTDYAPFKERFRGFCDFMEQSGNPLPDNHIFAITCPEDENRFLEFLKGHLPVLKEIDGIFAGFDKLAIDAIYALPELGVTIPDDLSIIGFDGLTLSQFVSPTLTTIRQPVEEIGRKALEIVLNPTEGASYPPVIQISPVLQRGATVLMKKDRSSVFFKTTKTRKGSK